MADKLHWNDRQGQWQGTSGSAFVELSDEKMRELIEQDLARFGSEPSEQDRIDAANRWMNVDRYALPIDGVSVTGAIRDESPPRRLRGAKD